MSRLCLLLLSINSLMFPAASLFFKMSLREGVRNLQIASGLPLQIAGSGRATMSYRLTQNAEKPYREDHRQSTRDVLHDPASNMQKIMESGDRELLCSLLAAQADEIRRLQQTKSPNFSITALYQLPLSVLRLYEKYVPMLKATMKEWGVNRAKQIYAHRRYWITEKVKVLGRVSDDDIFFAVEHADNELIKLLLECGANPNAFTRGTPLADSAISKCDAIGLKMLLEAGSKIYYEDEKICDLLRYADGDCKDSIRKIMLLATLINDHTLEDLIFLAPLNWPLFKSYFENIQVIRDNSASASEKKQAEDVIRLFMQEHGIEEKDVTIVTKT